MTVKKSTSKRLTTDFGCGSCIGYDDFIKDKFLREANGYLKDVATRLSILGWESSVKAKPSVRVNRGGVAVSGEATLVMKKDECFLYVQIGSSVIGQVSGKRHPNNVYILYRTSTEKNDIYACQGNNLYADPMQDSESLVVLIGK